MDVRKCPLLSALFKIALCALLCVPFAITLQSSRDFFSVRKCALDSRLLFISRAKFKWDEWDRVGPLGALTSMQVIREYAGNGACILKPFVDIDLG